MGRTLVIAKKEMKDTLRDRRTMLLLVVFPMVVMPALMLLILRFTERQAESADAEYVEIALIGDEYAPGLRQAVAADTQIVVVPGVRPDDVRNLIRRDSLDGAIVVPSDFQDRVDADAQASMMILFQSSRSFDVTERRLRDVVEAYDDEIVSGRISRLALDPDLFDAIDTQEVDLATLQEVLGQQVGGFLPYLFVIFMLTAAMNVGIDLSAGEKERGTLETLLSSPATRFEIVVGKFLVISLVAIASAFAAIVSISLVVRFGIGEEIPPEIMEVIWSILNVKVIAMLATLLIPLAAFFASAVLAIAIMAKSFKEAQGSLMPLMMVVIVPVLLGVLPGMELNARTALVPILNVSLATKDVISGTINPLHLAISYASLFALAGLSLWFCVKWFSREETLFRN
ncbi:MAG: ABC transporter permease [Gemmatimonadetes bacterium]|nr:ABC transporter permease [Gemmatimonadota bacterium]